MGSYNFHTIVMTTDDVQTAYDEACADALFESGQDRYNGTISTTESVYAVPSLPMTVAEANVIVSERIDSLNKWGTCEALPLVHEIPAQYENGETIEVSVSLNAAAYNNPETLKAAIAKKARIKADEIGTFSVARGLKFNPHQTAITKVDTKATEGKTETRYFVLSPQNSKMPLWKSGHPTQAAARAAIPADQVWNLGIGVEDREYEIIAMTRRVSGEPLVKATVTVRKVEATFTVQTHRKIANAVVGKGQAGWLFYGWAAC